MPNKPKEKSNFFIITLIVSFLVGGVSGGIIGGLSANYFASSDSSSTTINKQINIEESSATIDVVEEVSPSVVSIVISKDLSEIYNLDDPFGFFYGYGTPQGQTEIGGGTGFIIDANGLILTNKHVISDTEADYTVITNDGSSYEATIIGTDPFNDLGIVKIEATGLKPVALADSNQIQIGQTAIAIGNTLGEYRNTVTRGVISGIDRTITAGDYSGAAEVIEEAIQTDAAINPGNSGGPLLDLEGQVIGVNTAINREGESIGFAIPINIAKPVIVSVQKHGRIIRPMLGIRYRIINQEFAEANDMSIDYGVLLISGDGPGQLAVVPDSPADQAGLQKDDIILEFNGQKIDADHSLAGEIAKYQVGDIVSLKIIHNNEEKIINVTLAEYNLE